MLHKFYNYLPSIILKWWIVGHVVDFLASTRAFLTSIIQMPLLILLLVLLLVVLCLLCSNPLSTQVLNSLGTKTTSLVKYNSTTCRKDASDATVETGTNNISRAIIESMGYLLWFVFHQPNKSNDHSSSISSKGWFK